MLLWDSSITRVIKVLITLIKVLITLINVIKLHNTNIRIIKFEIK